MSRRILLLQALSSTPGDLRRTLRLVPEADRLHRPEPEGWSPAEIVSHLIDVEGRSRARLQQVCAEDNPQVEKIWPQESAHDPAMTLDQLLESFEAARGATVRFLAELSPGAWQRPAFFPQHGNTSLRFLVQDLVHHDIQHLDQLAVAVRDLRAKSRPSEAPHGR